MGLQYRRLLSDGKEIESCCDDKTDSSGYCVESCFNWCSKYCSDKLCPPPPPPAQFEHKSKKILISTLSISLTIFILVCCYVAYVKFFSGSVRRRRQREDDQEQEQRTEIEREFLDEDHGPMVDHPIWYIRTVGLQPSVISSISVCKYKRGDGLVESTDCSICLSEFEDDETLRLLPKCSHAFHIPCIDTWLRSHTNCPVCRAPIVANTNRATTSSEANVGSSSSGEEGLVEVAEQDRTERVADREIEGEDHDGSEEEDELRVDNRRKRNEVFDEDENGIQPLRRSISLDSLSALKISQVLSNLPTHESHQNCDSRMVEANESHTGIVSRRGGINQGLLSFMASSSVGRSFQSFQIGPSSIKRSFSCSAKLFLPRHNRS